MAKIKNRCSIYIKFGGKKVKIPVNPEEIEIEYPTDNKTYNVLGKGEIVVPRKPSLKVVSWDSFFPSGNDPYINSGAKDPENYERLFSKAMKNKTVCRLIISRSGLYDTNMQCIVSSFKTTDKGGEPRDIYYSVELMEYRSYDPETVSIVTTPAESTGEAAEVTADAERAVETPVVRVGATVIANGKYWYDSTGSSPYGTANNISTTITRIVDGAAYPIHIGSYGWVQESQLQITG